MNKKIIVLILASVVVILLVSCSAQSAPAVDSGKLKVVATTTIVGDVAAQVGGDLIQLSVLLPVGIDPHSFEPTPQDVAKVAEADLIFANGAGLEEFLDNLIESAGADDKVVSLSEEIALLERPLHGGDDEHSLGDPHTWTDPNNVMVWTQKVSRTLGEADPANVNAYAANAEKYQTELEELDAWIREQVSQIPVEQRKIVTDHRLFGYFVEEYGFEQVGAIIPGYSSLAEPSAQELAAIEDAIHDLDVKAVFVGNTVNPMLAERIAEDTGTQLISIYTGSLSEPGGGAESYLTYMRYNTIAFVDALK